MRVVYVSPTDVAEVTTVSLVKREKYRCSSIPDYPRTFLLVID